MTQYVAAVWKCRYFWLSLVQADLRSRYRRSLLGLGWSLLHPIAMTAVLCTVFGKVFNEDPLTFAPVLLVGLCFWNFVATATKDGCQCLFQAEKYIRQYPAPMAIYPLRIVLGASFHLLMALLVVLAMRLAFKGTYGLSTCVSLVPTLTMLLVFGWSLSVLAGFSTAYFPDVLHLSDVALQILFYASGIITPPDVLRQRGLAWIVDYNPLSAFAELLREPLLKGEWPSQDLFALAGLATVVTATCAVSMLVKQEKKIIFQL